MNLKDALLGKYPKSVMKVVEGKRGRGRPRKVVQVEGKYIHKEPLKSNFKSLTPADIHKMKQRWNQLHMENPKIGIVTAVYTISVEYGLTYHQVFDVVA